jgi:DNA-binding response OmpR family regulator
MNNQKLIIYDFATLFYILEELKNEINFEIINISKENFLEIQLYNRTNSLVVAYKKVLTINNLYVFNHPPIKIKKLIEKFNVEFLKQKFNEQAEVSIGRYKINLNSREMFFKQMNLKLTEKEINIIIYLSKFNKSVKVEELKSNVWGYQSVLDTHTVETHIYRLRKKILKTFSDKNFIISKREGYYISKEHKLSKSGTQLLNNL